MPYIKRKEREFLDSSIDFNSIKSSVQTTGQMNYTISKIILNFISLLEERYSTYNEAIGVLECVKLELYRRQIALYEDKKILENGDL